MEMHIAYDFMLTSECVFVLFVFMFTTLMYILIMVTVCYILAVKLNIKVLDSFKVRCLILYQVMSMTVVVHSFDVFVL